MLSRHNVPNPRLPVWATPSSSGASFQRTIDRLFEELETAFEAPSASSFAVGRHRKGRAQMRDKGDSVAIIVELPGLCASDVELSIADGVLQLRATPPTAAVPEGFERLRCERTRRAVALSIALPYAVDAAAASSTLSDGRLEIHLPKAPEARPRQIPVKVAQSNGHPPATAVGRGTGTANSK